MTSLFSAGAPFIELKQVESTNNYAIGLAHEGMAQHGTVVFAHHQTKGKGQREKQWQSEAGKNISLSILIQPSFLSLSQSFLLSMAMAVGTYRLFTKYAGNETKIKWPNDIYWRDRKAAGTLIENVVQGSQWKWAVVGIGINVNQTAFPDVLTKTASLKQITGKTFEPLALAKELYTFLNEAFVELAATNNEIKAAYKAALFKLNEDVVFKQGARIFSGTVKDVNTNGQLLVQTTLEEQFDVGELEWMLS